MKWKLKEKWVKIKLNENTAKVTRVSCTKNNNIGRAFDRERWRLSAGNAHCSTVVRGGREKTGAKAFSLLSTATTVRALALRLGGPLRSRGHWIISFPRIVIFKFNVFQETTQYCKQKEIGFVIPNDCVKRK